MRAILDRIRYWKSNLSRRFVWGMSPHTIEQWQFMQTLGQRTVVARRVFFLLSTGSIYSRDPKDLTDALGRLALEIAEAPPPETQVCDALAELVAYGLLDECHRPGMLIDIVV